jgi:hypothetical protein
VYKLQLERDNALTQFEEMKGKLHKAVEMADQAEKDRKAVDLLYQTVKKDHQEQTHRNEEIGMEMINLLNAKVRLREKCERKCSIDL